MGDPLPAAEMTDMIVSPGEGNHNPVQYPCLGNPIDRGPWWATIHRVARVRHDLATEQ